MNVAGIGIVFSGGRGINCYDDALKHGWIKPEDSGYRVKEESIIDKKALGGIRRADRFSKMAVLAASDAVVDSDIDLNKKKSSLGIIVSTAFGPHVTTFRFLDDMFLHVGIKIDEIRAVACDSDCQAAVLLRLFLRHSQDFCVNDIAFHVRAAHAQIRSQQIFHLLNTTFALSGRGMQIEDQGRARRGQAVIYFASGFQ